MQRETASLTLVVTVYVIAGAAGATLAPPGTCAQGKWERTPAPPPALHQTQCRWVPGVPVSNLPRRREITFLLTMSALTGVPMSVTVLVDALRTCEEEPDQAIGQAHDHRSPGNVHNVVVPGGNDDQCHKGRIQHA